MNYVYLRRDHKFIINMPSASSVRLTSVEEDVEGIDIDGTEVASQEELEASPSTPSTEEQDFTPSKGFILVRTSRQSRL